MSHYHSETIQYNGRWYNIPTKDGGKPISKAARDRMISTLARTKQQGFRTMEEAVAQARRRSNREIQPNYRRKNK